MGLEQAAVHKLGRGQGLDLCMNCLGLMWSSLTNFHRQTLIVSDRPYED